MTVLDLLKMVCDHCFGDFNWCCSHTKDVVAKEHIKVVCIDADASDPINAQFYEWKNKHW